MSVEFERLENNFDEGLDSGDELYSLLYFPHFERLSVFGQERVLRIYCARSYKQLKCYQLRGKDSSPKLAKWDESKMIVCFEKKWKLIMYSVDDSFDVEEFEMKVDSDNFPTEFRAGDAFRMVMRISNDRVIFVTTDSKMGIFSLPQRKIVKTLVRVSSELRRYATMNLSLKFANTFYICNHNILNRYEGEKFFEKRQAVALRINFETTKIEKSFRNDNLGDYDNVFSNSVYVNHDDIEILVLSSDKDLSFHNTETGDLIRIIETPEHTEIRSTFIFNGQFLITGRWYWNSGADQRGSVEIFNLLDDASKSDNKDFYVRRIGMMDFYHESGVSCIQVTKRTSDHSFVLATGGYDSVVRFMEVGNTPRIRRSSLFLEMEDLDERMKYTIQSGSSLFEGEEKRRSEFLVSVKIVSKGMFLTDFYKSLFC